ncbi:hypothetical protein JOF29_006046 [Kribbella aluminosa]|uniref:Conjugal transfer protein TrbC n=1 Tax=Kribbella aluminosa TaxID=416017 RepID=A0ABS4UTG4_9ACTN|nr:DUF6112 family protein [Kribbella aluminosa]MBP2354936.1 hypothetical protein [Kribbella aluminosa]
MLSFFQLQDPGVSPNANGLPGLPALRQIVGALQTFSLVVCVAAFVISAVAWAMGSLGSNSHYAGRGKIGCLVAAGAAVLIASANPIIRFFSGIQIG